MAYGRDDDDVQIRVNRVVIVGVRQPRDVSVKFKIPDSVFYGMPLGACDISEFSNENVFVRIQENVRSRDVYLIQSMATPVNTSIMELLIMIDAFRRASAGRITAVVPYYAYGRSDKKDQPRVPITAKLVATS